MRTWSICFGVAGLSVSLAPAVLVAQTGDPHAALPERPSVATHAQTVAPGWVELELGFQRARANGQFGDEAWPLAIKVGLERRLQLTAATTLSRLAGDPKRSIGYVNLGIKWRVAERVPLAGDVAILPSVTMPADSDTRAAAGLLVIASRSFAGLSLDVNAGYIRRRGDGTLAPKSESLWAAALGGPLIGRLDWFGELSGSPSTSGPAGRGATTNAMIGAAATLRPPFVVDVAFSIPVSGPDSFRS